MTTMKRYNGDTLQKHLIRFTLRLMTMHCKCTLTPKCLSLRERVSTQKVFIKDKTEVVFFLDYHQFFIISYVLDVY